MRHSIILPFFRYITIDDLNEMLRSNDGSMDEVILDMWKEGVQSVWCKSKDRISFEDFQRFFKGHYSKQGDTGRIETFQGAKRMSTLQENSVANHLSPSRSSHRNTKKRSVTSERLLTSTLALDLDGTSESHTFREDDFTPVTQAGHRVSGCAILIQSRDIGVFE